MAVTTGTGATPGEYSVSVTSLAAAQSMATSSFASSTATLSAGTLRIELGEYNAGQTTFTPRSGATAMDVEVTATDTVASIRDKINALARA